LAAFLFSARGFRKLETRKVANFGEQKPARTRDQNREVFPASVRMFHGEKRVTSALKASAKRWRDRDQGVRFSTLNATGRMAVPACLSSE
jgi:hypothetical protein